MSLLDKLQESQTKEMKRIEVEILSKNYHFGRSVPKTNLLRHNRRFIRYGPVTFVTSAGGLLQRCSSLLLFIHKLCHTWQPHIPHSVTCWYVSLYLLLSTITHALRRYAKKQYVQHKSTSILQVCPYHNTYKNTNHVP